MGTAIRAQRYREWQSNREVAISQDEATIDMEQVKERIARKAYELFEQRGGAGGREVEDWLEAERIIKDEMKQHKARSHVREKLTGRIHA